MGFRLVLATLIAFALLACGSAGSGDMDGGPAGDAARRDDGGPLVPDAGLVPGLCDARGQTLPERAGTTIRVAPAAAGMVSVDGATRTLRSVVAGAEAGDTVLLEDGVYTFPSAGAGEYTGLYFTTADVTLRSASGDAGAVVLDSAYTDHGDSTAPITIDAPGIVIANITVQRSIFHLVHLWANGDSAILHNVRLIDGGQQFVKASPGAGTVDQVEVSCTQFLMTSAGRDNVWGYGAQDGFTRCYTGGIDTHQSRNWHIHDSHFEGIYCDAAGVPRPAHGKKGGLRDNMTYNGGLAEHAIHMWDSEAGSSHVIERNRIIDCARGIGLGLRDPVYGGIIRNNMVFSRHPASGEHDVAIIVERGQDTLIANNTIIYTATNAYPSSIEYRWDTSSGLRILNNLSNRPLRARDNAPANTASNVVDAQTSWFASPATGDLHLSTCGLASVVGGGQMLAEVTDDFDGAPRPTANDVGADQCAQ